MKPKFRKPFTVYPPLEEWEKDLGTKESGRTTSKYQDGINDLWTVEDAYGLIISSHKTEKAANEALARANANL